jgi:hypothetical protein
MAIDWRRDLMLWHPRLFLTMTEEPSRSFGYPHCERGWQDILVRLCRRIEIALRDRETFEFVRIKQKMGILRVDWDAEASDSTEAAIGHAVDLGVARSAGTCEICGAEGRLYSSRGWLGTRCGEHAAGADINSRRLNPAPHSEHVTSPFSISHSQTKWRIHNMSYDETRTLPDSN